LRRANIETFAWVINKSVLASGTRDPLLQARMAGEAHQIARIENGLAKRIYLLPWLAQAPIGVVALGKLVQAK
jgi:arsenite/tail-anchored protein-transporting ATPase